MSMRGFAIGCALAVVGAGSVDRASARECCNISCGTFEPVCVVSDTANCQVICDSGCSSFGGCTTFTASTCSPDLAVGSCDGNCQAVCATFTPLPTVTPIAATAPAPTMSSGVLALMVVGLGLLASVALRGRRQGGGSEE